MKRAVIAAATAALLAGSAIAHAAGPADAAAPQSTQQAAPQTAAPPAAAPANPQATAAKRAAVFDARIADLKGALKLTADQEKLWPAFETTLRNVAQERAARMDALHAARQAARQSGQRPARPDMVTRMRAASDRMATASGELRQVADTLDPLYKTFDPAQKKVFEQAARKDLRSFFGTPHPRRGDGPRRGEGPRGG
ncbi:MULTISPECIES: Spy/CpxP family protein refolding chaperone [Xanthobacter]|uniref:Spy/CpxP family protein refolding chaperone n=1 Tax=Xanthobacter TaxID=279 RepID=UPI001F3EBEB7|nr:MULTISPECIES: Spy/CpxP family protein refolding chaperone [unclassified Xanthobacter]